MLASVQRLAKKNVQCFRTSAIYSERDSDHNEKPLDSGVDQALSMRSCINGGRNCFLSCAQEVTGSQEDHVEHRILVLHAYLAHNPTLQACSLKTSETHLYASNKNGSSERVA